MSGIGQSLRAVLHELSEDVAWQPPDDSASQPDSESMLAREAAQALACRCARGLLAYPAVLLITGLAAPGETRRLMFVVPWGLLLLLVVALRLAAMLPFDSCYTPDPGRWRRRFRAGVYCSGAVWVVFALQYMIVNDSTWPTWMVLLLTAGIVAGSATSLAPDPPVLYRLLALLLGPLLLRGLFQGGSCGHAIAIVVAVYAAFILAQARHNCREFRQSTLDKQALREASRRRDALVNSIDGIVWEAEPRRRQCTFVSRRAETILGYPVERWVGEASFWESHIHPDDRKHAIASGDRTAAGGDYTVEYRMTASDGHPVRFRDLVTAGKERGRVVAVRGVMVDITARKRASQERDMLADALRTVREAVGISDPEDRILFVNDAFLALYGYRREEVLYRNIRLVRSPKNPPELDAAIAEATRRGGWQGEVWNRRKDETEFQISLSTSLVRDRAGHTIALVGVANDITERKRAEDELKRAKEAAEAASLAKSEFLANLSHEIRTPMNGIIGMNRLLVGTALDPRQRRYAELVRQSAGFLLSVLDDILDFSRIESGELRLDTGDFDLHSIAGTVCDLVAAKAQNKGVELFCHIAAAVPSEILGDPGRLRQVLANLVGNAVKFTGAGEISIGVRVESAGPPLLLRFEVRDTGIGVPPEKRSLLFQPFSQVDASAARRHGGTGLGLTLVRRLVELMGGQAGFESRETVGSTFWFTAAFTLQPGAQPTPHSFAGRRASASMTFRSLPLPRTPCLAIAKSVSPPA